MTHADFWGQAPGSGRTRRAVLEAIATANRQGYCFFVVHDARGVSRAIERIAGADSGAEQVCGDKVYLRGGGQVAVVPASNPRVDLAHGRMTGAHPGCGVVADHHAIERTMPWALKSWLRHNGLASNNGDKQ